MARTYGCIFDTRGHKYGPYVRMSKNAPSVNSFKKRLDDYYQDGPAVKLTLLWSIIYKYK